MTFKTLTIGKNCLIFDDAIKISILNFLEGEGFETLLTLPSTTKERIIEVHSYLYLNDCINRHNAEYVNNEYEKTLKKLK